MGKKPRRLKVDEFSNVTELEVGFRNLPKDKYEPFIRVLAGIVFLLSVFPIIYVIFYGRWSDFWTAFFISVLVGMPAVLFALRGNSAFGFGNVYGRTVSPLWIWLAIFFTLAFFCGPVFLYIFKR